jgi:hypothetical protein
MKNLLLATAISVSIPLNTFAQTITPMHEVAGVPLVEVSVNGAESNERTDVWRTDRNMVVRHWFTAGLEI